MEWNVSFFITSVLLGAGLAMDAFSVSLANGLNEPCMKKPRMCLVAGVFAFFQGGPKEGRLCRGETLSKKHTLKLSFFVVSLVNKKSLCYNYYV